jgi:hypothetical protein
LLLGSSTSRENCNTTSRLLSLESSSAVKKKPRNFRTEASHAPRYRSAFATTRVKINQTTGQAVSTDHILARNTPGRAAYDAPHNPDAQARLKPCPATSWLARTAPHTDRRPVAGLRAVAVTVTRAGGRSGTSQRPQRSERQSLFDVDGVSAGPAAAAGWGRFAAVGRLGAPACACACAGERMGRADEARAALRKAFVFPLGPTGRRRLR